MAKQVTVYYNDSEYEALEGFADSLGLSLYALIKASSLLVLSCKSEFGREDSTEASDTLSSVFVRGLASRERRCRMPRAVSYIHPYALRFTEEEYGAISCAVQAGGEPRCDLLGKEDVLHNLFLGLYRDGDLGCSDYESYKEKAYQRFKL